MSTQLATLTNKLAAISVIKRMTKITETGCWEWVGSKRSGYGQLTFKGKLQSAHRFSYKLFNGEIKDNNWILHHCDNRCCVNPAHLYQGTPIDNRADMLKRNRWKHPWRYRKTCAKGHSYDDVGFSIAKDGSRVCKECQRNYKREQRAKLKQNEV